MNYYETTDKDEDDDIWYTVYCGSDNETEEETWIQVKTTSAMVPGISPLSNYTCCVELTEVPYTRKTCQTITTGPPNSELHVLVHVHVYPVT